MPHLKTSNSRLQTPNSKFQISTSKFQIPNFGLQIPDSKLGLRTMRLQVRSSRLEVRPSRSKVHVACTCAYIEWSAQPALARIQKKPSSSSATLAVSSVPVPVRAPPLVSSAVIFVRNSGGVIDASARCRNASRRSVESYGTSLPYTPHLRIGVRGECAFRLDPSQI